MTDLQSAVILALIFGALSWIPGFRNLMFRVAELAGVTELAGIRITPDHPLLIWVGFGFAIGIGCRFLLDAYTTLMKLGSAGVRGATEGIFSGGGGGAQKSAVQSIVIFGCAISIVAFTSTIMDFIGPIKSYIQSVENTLLIIGDYLAVTLGVVLIFIGVIAYRTGRFVRTVARKKVSAPQFLFGAFFFGLLQIVDLRVGIFALVIAFLAAGFSPSLALRIPLFFAIPASLMTGFALIAGSGGSILTESVILVLIGVSALSTFVVLSFVFRFTEKLSLGSFSGLIGILILVVSSNILFGFSLAKLGYYALFGIGAVGASIFSFELFTEVSRRHKVKGITMEILNETKRSTEQARIIKAVEANKLTTSTGEIENIAEPLNFMVRQGKVERINSVVKSVSEKELRQIQGEMGDPDPKRRREVLQKLNDIMASLPDLTLKEFSAIKELEAALEIALADESEWVRYFAVDSYSHLIAAYGMVLSNTLPEWVTKTVDKLTPLLNDIDVDVRYITAKTIGVIGGIDAEKVSSAIPQLIVLTGDANTEVRYIAIDALKQIALPKVVSSGLPRIIDKFNDQDKEVRLAAIRTVGEFHKIAPNETGAAIEPLKNLRKDSDKEVRTEASSVLAIISSDVARVAPISEIADAKAVIEKPVEKRATIRPTITHLLTNLKLQNTELGKVLKVVEQGDNMNYLISISFKNIEKPLKKIKIIDEMPPSYELIKILPPKQKSKVRKRNDRKDIEFALKDLDIGQTFAVAYTIEGSEPYISKPPRIEIEGFIETGTTTDAMEKEKKKKYRLPALHALLRKEHFSELPDRGSR
ncbi:MAG: sister chromatid cohesion protein PDS5 [Promethearchaeota archaeon]